MYLTLHLNYDASLVMKPDDINNNNNSITTEVVVVVAANTAIVSRVAVAKVEKRLCFLGYY